MYGFLLLAMWTVPVPCRGINNSADRGVGPMFSSSAGTGTGADCTLLLSVRWGDLVDPRCWVDGPAHGWRHTIVFRPHTAGCLPSTADRNSNPVAGLAGSCPMTSGQCEESGHHLPLSHRRRSRPSSFFSSWQALLLSAPRPTQWWLEALHGGGVQETRIPSI